MPVDTVEELFEGRGGRDDFTKHRTFTRVYEVYTTDPSDGPGVAGGTVLLPRLGDPHPEDPASVVVTVAPLQDAADPLRWLVTIEYDTQPPLPNALQPDGSTITPGTLQENPLARPPAWKLSFQQVPEVLRSAYQMDGNGTNIGGSVPVTNSAGFLFDPPVMIEVSRPIIQVSRNVAGLLLTDATELQDAINSLPWKGLPAFTARCIGIEAASAFENGVHFFTLTYTFALKDDGWFVRVLDAGTMERIILGSDPEGPPGALLSELRAILDPAGNPISEPVPLDGDGKKLKAGLPEVYRVFSAYKQRDFNALVLI